MRERHTTNTYDRIITDSSLSGVDLFSVGIQICTTVIVFWLFIYFLNRSLEPRYSKAAETIGAGVAFALLVVCMFALILLNVTLDYAFVVTSIAVLYIYALIFRTGGALPKLFWLLVCLSFYIISSVATKALELALLSETSAAETPYWMSILFATLTLVLTGNFLRPITRKKMHLINLSPTAMITLTLVPLISCVVLVLFGYYTEIPPGGAQRHALILFASSVGIGIVVYCTFALFKHLTNQARRDLKQQAMLQQANLTKTHLDEVSALYKEVKDWRHDYSNNLQVLYACVESGNYEKLKKYLDAMGASLEKISFRYNVGDDLLNAILNAKATRADSAGIKLNVTGTVDSIDTFMTPIDMASLVGNILDNAIEGCQRIVSSSSPLEIDLQFSQSESDMKIYQKNPTDGNLKVVDGVLQTSKTESNHGIGSSLIQAVVEKYHGYMDIKITKSEFELFVLLKTSIQSRPPKKTTT